MESNERTLASLAVIAEDQQKDLNKQLRRLDAACDQIERQRLALDKTARTAVASAIDEKTETAQQAMTEATGRLDRARDAFRWKTIAVAGAVCAAGLVLVIVAGWAGIAWQTHRMASLQEKIDTMQVNIADLEAQGGQIILTHCGDERLCAAIDTDAPVYTGANGQKYRILAGY